MQSNRIKATGVVAIILIILAGFLVYQWKNPMGSIEGLWSAEIYNETDSNVYRTVVRLNISDRTLTFSSVTRDLTGKSVSDHRSVLEFLRRSGGNNLFKTIESRSNTSSVHQNESGFSKQQFYYQHLSPKFYQIDCNTLILDMSPGAELGYTTKFTRINARTCK